MHLHDYNLVPQCEQLQPHHRVSTIADFATVQQQTFMSIMSQEKKRPGACPLLEEFGWGWYSLHAIVSGACRSPVVRGKDVCQPLEEPPALQLVGGSLCLPQSSSVGQ